MNFINQIEPWIDDNELYHLKRIIDSKFVVENQLTKEFEDLVKKHTGSKHAIAYTNGTCALYACLKSLNIGPGDEVIVPNLTFIATANAVIMAGGTPIFCEIDSNSLCIDINELESLINEKTKAIIPVHLYGLSADIEKIVEIAKKYNLSVIEDAAQGVGVHYKNKHVGTFGDLGVLSYYGNKTITCGEGGIILTENDELAKICYRLKNHGRDKKGVFEHEHIGFNFSFTEMQAAIGISQMEKFNLINNKKRLIYDNYVKELTNVGDIKFQNISDDITPVFWFTSFFTNHKKELKSFLLKKNIQTRDFFLPLNLQPCYKYLNIEKPFDISKESYEKGISVPSSYNLTEEEQIYIIDNIKQFFKL